MSPRPGGEASKFGARYEGVWTVRQLLEVLSGRAESITVERAGEAGKGVEFELKRLDGTVEVHQVKRQRGSANSWTLRALQSEGVLEAASRHVKTGREFHFVSLIPSRRLDRLSDRARRSTDLRQFIEEQLGGGEIGDDFNFLASEVWGSPQEAWEILRGVRARWPDERELSDSNIALASVLLAGAPPALTPLGLGDLIVQDLGVPLTTRSVGERLGRYEMRLDPLLRRTSLAASVTALTRGWREGIEAELLDPRIARTEGVELADLLAGEARLIVASGNAGDGKTGVLHQVVDKTMGLDWPVLAVRLDRLEPFGSPEALGEQLGLEVSPAATLGALAGDHPALLLIDQLDAVSLASGRMPSSFEAVAELLREAAAFPRVRVLMACRQFDMDNDNRLRALVAETGPAIPFRIDALSGEQVEDALGAIGIEPRALSDRQLELLRSPLHLVLLSAVAADEGALSFSTTKDLFDLFWENKARAVRRDRRPPPRFTQVIDTLIEAISSEQRLSVAAAALDSDDLLGDADVMASEHILVRDGSQVAFFHETFFDYAFARRWIRRGQSLVDFLLEGEQELFRRAQIRQVLTHLRDGDSGRFAREMASVLADERVRFHIKDVVLGLLRSLPAPTREEWRVVDSLLSAGVPFEERLWRSLRTVEWFDRLLVEGKPAEWLASDDDSLRGRAVDVMAAAVKDRGAEVAELLKGHRSEPGFTRTLLWITRFADLERNRALFDLVLETVRGGGIDGSEQGLWLDAHGLGDSEPAWGVELIATFLTERPARLALGGDGKVSDLESSDHGLLELVSRSAAGAPGQFCEALLGYLLSVMAATAEGSAKPIRDRHFGFRIWRAQVHELDDALLLGFRNALASVAQEEPEAARALFQSLEEDPHDAAQWLLYEGLRAGDQTYADQAADILLQREDRLYSGYLDSGLWTTRQLLEAIGEGIKESLFVRLEQAILALRPAWEKQGGGYSSFTLLTALPQDRLSADGIRRLGELRRKFDNEQPREPMGIRVQSVGSPIPEAAAKMMSDIQWLGAIARYSSEERDRGIELRGGAEELSNVLQAETKRDPDRFLALALRFDAATHPAYTNAVLMALSDTDVSVEGEPTFEFLHHVDRLGRPENDRWFARALRGYLEIDIPDAIIELVLDRALHSPDPEREAWLTETSWSGQSFYGGDPWSNGMNTARGAAAEGLADLLIYDSDGRRSALLGPRLGDLAGDESTAVRACAARVIAAALRYRRAEAIDAFGLLIQADDRLLATRPVEELIAYVGRGDPQVAAPTIERMLGSEYESVRVAGGGLAAFAGLEFGPEGLLRQAVDSSDAATRRGAARVCAEMIARNSDQGAAVDALRKFFDDIDDGVRSAAAGVAAVLREEDLSPYVGLLRSLIESESFAPALAQLLITLEGSTSRVEELALLCAERFLLTHRDEMSNIETGAAADSRHVGELLLRAYSQSTDRALRARTLSLIDDLLQLEAYGVGDLVEAAER